MTSHAVVQFAYIAASILFIFGIKMLGKAETARRGNSLSAVGMLVAVVVTLVDHDFLGGWVWVAAGLALGAVIGLVAARVVPMTSMPEMVALFNGFGGAASLLVGWAEYERMMGGSAEAGGPVSPSFTAAAIASAVIIGGVTFTGSMYAYGKLAGVVSGRAVLFRGLRELNGLLVVLSLAAAAVYAWDPAGPWAYPAFLVFLIACNVLGISGVMPIGGGDMPVVISLLNSLSGMAAVAAGFVVLNEVLIVAGCLVGASGLILTVIMCKSMNRSLGNVLFSGFGALDQEGGAKIEGEMKAASIEDAYYVLEAARSVVVIPGYGMAVAQAQHAVKELGEHLEANGAEILYAIHPVAGRMPGHMNVLLAEADVAYEQLVELEQINPRMPTIDVAIVIGANDVVNPAAALDQSSPIYGMPIINAHEARTVFALKRGKGAGFSGLVNNLYFLEKTRMLYGDAKATVSALVSEFKKG